MRPIAQWAVDWSRIGHSAQKRIGGSRIYVFKRPDGSVLIADATDFLHVSKTTVYGLAYTHGANGTKNYRFTYRPDIGLVYKKSDPDTYARLVAEAGPVLEELIRKGRQKKEVLAQRQICIGRFPQISPN